MTALAILAFLTGAVLAFRFRVLILYPIIAVGATFGMVLGMAAGNSLSTVLFGIVAAAMAIQFGYVFGTVGRMSILAAHVSARRSRHNATVPTQAI